MNVNLWTSSEHALDYLSRADSLPHRVEGEATLLECLPAGVERVLDIGTGDGRLLALVKLDHPAAQSIALDFSPTMLQASRTRWKDDPTVRIVEHNLDQRLPDLGHFDAV